MNKLDGFLKLHPADNVIISMKDTKNYKKGHKYSLQKMQNGTEIIKYGNKIGKLVGEVEKFQLINEKNLAPLEKYENKFSKLDSGFEENLSVKLYYNKKNNSYATRKNIIIISMVSCVNRVVNEIAAINLNWKEKNIQIVPITHDSGCGLVRGQYDHRLLTNIINGYGKNPNTFGIIAIGLGCEDNQLDSGYDDDIHHLSIQEIGESKVKVRATELINEIAETIVNVPTENRTLRDLKVGLQCGGSDGLSAITANPLVGYVTTYLLNKGSGVVLSETPEVRGFEKQLLSLCTDSKAKKLEKIFERWDSNEVGKDNPAPGNYAGGISSNIEKSIGSILKFGFNKIDDVLYFGERSENSGMLFMDSPGYDPCSITGQIANGCNVIIFTTGRGSNYKNSLVPIFKVSSNTEVYQKNSDFINLDAEKLMSNCEINKSVEIFMTCLISAIEKNYNEEYIHSDFIIPKLDGWN